MDTETIEAGAEVGANALLAQEEASQAAADAAFVEGQADGGDAAAATGAEGAEAKPPLAPLSPEELETRYRNINQALKAERGEKRQLRAQLEELTTRLQRVEAGPPAHQTELQAIEAELQQFARVDWDRWIEQDPFEAQRGKARLDALHGRRQQLQGEVERAGQEQQQQQQTALVQRVISTMTEQETEFKSAHPDYDDAILFLKEKLADDFRDQGFVNEAQIAAMVGNHAFQVAQRIMLQGGDAAEFAYNLATKRGYTRQAAASAAAKSAIDAVEAGAAAAKTLSDTGARTSSEGGSMEEKINNLSGAALRSYWAKVKANGGQA